MTDYRSAFIRKGEYKVTGLSAKKSFASFVCFCLGIFTFHEFLTSGAIITLLFSSVLLVIAFAFTFSCLRSNMVIDANGIRTEKYTIFGKVEKNEIAWKDVNKHSFSVDEPLAEVNSFFQFIMYLANKKDRILSDFPQVSIDIFEDVTDYVYFTEWNEIGNATIWNIVKEEKDGETIYRCGAAIYDGNDKLISSSSDRYVIGSTLYESDGSIVNGWEAGPNDDIEDIEDIPVFFNLEDRSIIFSDEGRQYEENGKKFISVGKYNINADFAGSAAQAAAAINHFAAKDLIDAESVEAMYRKALKFHLILIALVVIVIVLFCVAAYLGY